MSRPAFVNSLPKSGTNLVGDCLDLIGMKPQGHFGARMINQPTWARVLNRIRYAPIRKGYIVGIDMPVEVAARVIDRRILSLQKDQYVTAHVGYTTGILKKIVESKVAPILVTRDPRAVVNSSVHYLETAPQHPLFGLFQSDDHAANYHKVINGITYNGTQLQPIDVRCQAVMPWIHHPDVLHIRFEDLVGPDGGGTTEDQDQAVQEILIHLEANNITVDQIAKHIFGRNENTFRSGRVDAWRREVPDSVREILNERTRSICDSWGYHN